MQRALPRLRGIPTVPLPFVHRSKGARADAGVQVHLAGLDFPVITGVPLVPRPLCGAKEHDCDTRFLLEDFQKPKKIPNPLKCSEKQRTYDFIFLLSVEGSGPLPLGRCWSFGLRLGPACGALVGRTTRFKDAKRQGGDSGCVKNS